MKKNKIKNNSNTIYIIRITPKHNWILGRTTKEIQSVNDRLRNDIINYNNWLTKIMELKTELKTATFDIIQIISEFTFLFLLDNFEHINEKRIEFGETLLEEIENLNDELKHIWDGEYNSPHFESTLKVCSESINYIQGLEDYVQITDQGQINTNKYINTKRRSSKHKPTIKTKIKNKT